MILLLPMHQSLVFEVIMRRYRHNKKYLYSITTFVPLKAFKIILCLTSSTNSQYLMPNITASVRYGAFSLLDVLDLADLRVSCL